MKRKYSRSNRSASSAPPTVNETALRGRNRNGLNYEGFLDFHLRDRRQNATPQEPELNPEPPEKKRSGPLNRFLDDKPQESLDAINSLIEGTLQEIKTSIEANSRTLVAQIFWLAVAAELTASLITLTLVKAAFPFIKWILRKILNGIRDAKFIQAFNAELQTTTQEEPKHDATSKARLVYRRSLRCRPRFVSVSVFSRRKRRGAPRAVVINTKKFLVFSLKIALKSGILNSVAAARPVFSPRFARPTLRNFTGKPSVAPPKRIASGAVFAAATSTFAATYV